MSRPHANTDLNRQVAGAKQPLRMLGAAWLIPATFVLVVGLLSPACEKQEPAPGHSPGPRGHTPTARRSEAPGRTAANQAETPLATRPELGRGVDDRDSPDAPRALPKTSDLRDWVKSEPVRVVAANQLAALVENASLRSLLATFHLRRVARCAYQGKPGTARVLLIEAQTPADAFGIFSVLSPKPGELQPADGSVRATNASATGQTMAAWQGEACLQIEFSGGTGDSGRPECERLFNNIVFNLPAADPPLLLQAIPVDRRRDCQVWVVRSTAALATVRNEVLRKIDPATMDQRLGLTGEAMLSVAAVPVAEDEPPNLIWIVQYADPPAAAVAYQRYQQALVSPVGELDHNTLPYPPKGVFLAGSWTADQESIPNKSLLPVLLKALPAQP